jgi:hypothetical protein
MLRFEGSWTAAVANFGSRPNSPVSVWNTNSVRVALADLRRCFDDEGNLLPLHMIDANPTSRIGLRISEFALGR